MAITTTRGAAMRNWTRPNKTMISEMNGALALVQYANIWRNKKIAQYEDVRIDNQGPWSKGPGVNIQAQTDKASIAGVLLADSLGNAANPIDQAAVVNALQQAMRQSSGDGYFYEVTGTVPEALAVPEPGIPDQAVTAETTSG